MSFKSRYPAAGSNCNAYGLGNTDYIVLASPNPQDLASTLKRAQIKVFAPQRDVEDILRLSNCEAEKIFCSVLHSSTAESYHSGRVYVDLGCPWLALELTIVDVPGDEL